MEFEEAKALAIKRAEAGKQGFLLLDQLVWEGSRTAKATEHGLKFADNVRCDKVTRGDSVFAKVKKASDGDAEYVLPVLVDKVMLMIFDGMVKEQWLMCHHGG